MRINIYAKLLLGTLILFLLHGIIQLDSTPDEIIGTSKIFWGMLSSFLVVSALVLYVSSATLRGLKLALSVFVIYYFIGHFNLLIEAYIFNVTDRSETLDDLYRGFFLALLFAPILIYLFTRWKGDTTWLKFKSRSPLNWIWRIILGIFLYLLFYLTAGIILQTTYPGLMDFYNEKIPPFDVMILTQFPRGFLFVIISILILRTSRLQKPKKAILVGLIFSVLGAIAPLIPPSEFMPSNIRLVHGFEVGISNFLYGLILGYLLGQKIEKRIPSDMAYN